MGLAFLQLILKYWQCVNVHHGFVPHLKATLFECSEIHPSCNTDRSQKSRESGTLI